MNIGILLLTVLCVHINNQIDLDVDIFLIICKLHRLTTKVEPRFCVNENEISPETPRCGSHCVLQVCRWRSRSERPLVCVLPTPVIECNGVLPTWGGALCS